MPPCRSARDSQWSIPEGSGTRVTVFGLALLFSEPYGLV